MFEIENNILAKYTGTDGVVTVPEGIREIGWGAFEGSRSLKQVILPDSLQSIRGNAFGGCTALEEIHLPVSGNRLT